MKKSTAYQSPSCSSDSVASHDACWIRKVRAYRIFGILFSLLFFVALFYGLAKTAISMTAAWISFPENGISKDVEVEVGLADTVIGLPVALFSGIMYLICRSRVRALMRKICTHEPVNGS